jgi:hypothetical protein
MNIAQTEKISDVMTRFRQLSIREKISVSKAIDKEILIERAASLDKSVKPNDIHLTEIVSELKAYRSERKNIRSGC